MNTSVPNCINNMDNATIINRIRKLSEITDDDFKKFISLAELKIIKKNSNLVEQDTDISCMYFVKSGCFITYFEDKTRYKHVVQFAVDGWWIGDLQSASKLIPSIYTIKALADSAVLKFHYIDLENLIEEIPAFQKYFRYLFQNALAAGQRRIVENISLSAELRYESFLKLYPKAELIIPQKFVASYLGITPEFFSKMKAKKYAK